MIGKRMVRRTRYISGSVLVVVLSLTTVALAQDEGRDFHWSGKLAPDQIVEIKNLNGKIEARGDSSIDQVEVTAEKSGPDADLVRIEVVPHADGVTICTIYPGGSTNAKTGPCEAGEQWHVDSHNSKVKVNFTVRVPLNLRFSATSINGAVTAEEMGRFVRADSVNGSVRVSTKQWAELSSVNGSLEARMGSADWTGTLKMTTVNGSIDLKMPSELNADVRFSSVNGHLDTDYPLSVSGSIGNHRVEGRVGNGGRKLILDTVNGSVRMKRDSL